MIVTGRSLVTRALRLIQALPQGQTPGSNDLVDGFATLEEMIDGWGTDNLVVYATDIEDFDLDSGTATYTLGTSGDFNHVAPNWIPFASIITSNNPLQPLELPLDILDIGQWQGVPVKNTPSALPLKMYVKWTFPLVQLTFWPIPNVGDLQVRLYLPTQPVTSFGELDTEWNLAPGYARALRYNLAVDLAPEWGVDMEKFPLVGSKAMEYLGDIRRVNISKQNQMIGVDKGLIGKSDLFNYYTGEPM